MENLRIITNTDCNKRCGFCYQTDFSNNTIKYSMEEIEYLMKKLY